MYWFYKGPGYFYLEDFIVLDSWLALNTANLDGFRSYKINDSKIYNIGIYALFTDGSATFITRENEKKYNKNGHLDSYYDLLKQYREPNTQRETYYCIDNYISDRNTIVIPELLSPTELHFEKVDYKDALYNDVDVNHTKNDVTIPLDSIKESVKKIGRKK